MKRLFRRATPRPQETPPPGLAAAARAALDGVFGYFVAHRTAANLLMVLMLAWGVYAVSNLRAQFFPDFVIETVTVSVSWPGAGAEDVDDGVVSLIEPALTAVEGVETVTSTSREGSATVSAEFQENWDMARGVDEVKAAVDLIRDLPEDAEEPNVTRRAFRDRVTNVAISGPVGLEVLSRYADELSARLFQAGVTRVSIDGLATPEIRIESPEALRRRHDVTLSQIGQAIAREITPTPAGDIAASAVRIRAGSARRTAEEIGAVVVSSTPEGGKIYVRDVAKVFEAGESGVSYLRRGFPAVQVRVDRDAQGDAIGLQRAVERVAAEMRPTLPEGVEIELFSTRAQAITDRLNVLFANGLGGLLIVLGLLFLFLSARTAFWVAAGIPVSILATLGVMYAVGISINMISLFALIISLGIIVDDAIVVGEHADFLARRRGLDAKSAAALAARRMMAPVAAASITTVIAFSSMTMLGGRLGSLIVVMPMTVSAVVVASLIECFLILPNHMSHALAAKSRRPWYDAPSRAVNAGFNLFRDHLFRPIVQLSLRLRYLVIAGAVFMLLLSISMVVDKTVRYMRFFFPERSTVTANIAMLPGATRADTIAMLDEMARALEATAARYDAMQERPSVEFALSKVGGTLGRGLSAAEDKDADLLGAFQAELLDPDFREWEQQDFVRAWREEVEQHPMLEILAFRGQRSGGGGDAIHVEFTGADAPTLKAAAETLAQGLAQYPAVSGLEDTMSYDKTELLLTLTPRGEALGFDAEQVGAALRGRLSGVTAAEFARDSRSVKVIVAPPEEEIGADYLETTWLRAPDGRYAALSDIVDIESRQGFASVKRENGLRVIAVTGDIADDPAAEAEVRDALANELIPAVTERFGVEAVEKGASADERRFLSDALIGFILCLGGIYLTLAWVFASWRRPLAVMLIIPFGFVGALWGHHWYGIPMSTFSIVGMIGMSGIIINDSIVLITTVDEYARSRPFYRAVVEGVCDRLRPVLLTTLTTVAGLYPLLIEQSRQAAFLKPTVITLIYGLSLGLVLVLFAVPAVLMIQRDIGLSLASFRRAVKLALWPRRIRLRRRRDEGSYVT